MFRYRLHSPGGDDLGEATYAVMIKPGEEILVGAGQRFHVVVVVPFDEEDESPFVGLLPVEAAQARRRLGGVQLSRTGWIITAVVIFVVLLVAWTRLQALGGSGQFGGSWLLRRPTLPHLMLALLTIFAVIASSAGLQIRR